jgi:hypothetical protein
MGIWGSLSDGTLGKTAKSFTRLATTPAQSWIDDEHINPSDTLPQCSRRSRARAESAADRAERAADARTKCADDRDDGYDDQGQHHGVFDGRRAVFTCNEMSDSSDDLVNGYFPA